MRSIDSSLLSKINQQNQTIYNNANPKMSVQVSRAKTTVMDSTYWTVETIRTKEGLGDLSLAARRQKAYGPPNRIYNIYVDNGIVKTATREYPDYLKEKWKNQFELGNGTAVAIAFDGHWELYRNKWQLVTDENPYLFWVDNTAKLWVQLWDYIDTKFHLSDNVTKVKAIRGWKNINFADRDHGVIAAYIKSGKVYYRNYCTQLDGSTAWENERELTEFTGVAVNLNLFITNDYRTGFIIEDSLGKIYWFITDRNWVGMAIAPERLVANPYEIKLDLIELEKFKGYEVEYLKANPYDIELNFLFANTSNQILSASNKPNENDDWGWIIEFKAENPIPILDLANVNITSVSSGLPIGMANIEAIGENLYRVIADDVVENGFNNVFGDISITIFNVLNPAGYIYETMVKDFTPINLVPESIPIPKVEVIWNE